VQYILEATEVRLNIARSLAEPELCHKADEYIEISDLEKAVEYYKSIISHFLM
jgi:acetylornithine deacetylase/succinyl-diaminopimelate desuccinylase-like protein